MNEGQKKILDDFNITFRENRNITVDLLKALSSKELVMKWPRPGLDTFEKHFHELIAVQKEFIDSMNSGVIDFKGVPSVFDFPEGHSNEMILKSFEEIEKHQNEQFKKCKFKDKIDWFGMALPIEQHICNFVAHETFHQGMILMMFYVFNIKIPKSSIDNWVVPQISKKKGNK